VPEALRPFLNQNSEDTRVASARIVEVMQVRASAFICLTHPLRRVKIADHPGCVFG
jgi:hypothetical protein